MDQQETIGLIGAGLLGIALVERLTQQDLAVCGFDVDPQRIEMLASLGGQACDDPADIFARCETLLLSLPNSDVASELLHRHASSLRHGQTIIDTTTGDPDQMIAIADFLRGHGVDYVEANVAGSSEQARAGQAVLFIGGDETAVKRVDSLLASIATRHSYLGPAGSASRFKLVHNLILGLNRAVLAEGLVFAESIGFESQTALEILRQTPAASAVMDNKGKKMVDRDFRPQARLSQHLKDVRLILGEAGRAGLATPLSELHQSLLERAEALGFGESDNSAVIEVWRQANHEVDQ